MYGKRCNIPLGLYLSFIYLNAYDNDGKTSKCELQLQLLWAICMKSNIHSCGHLPHTKKTSQERQLTEKV